MNLEAKVTVSGPIVDGNAESSVDRLVARRVAEGAQAAKEQAQANAPARKGDLRRGIVVEGLGLIVATARHSAYVEMGHRQGKANPVQVKPRPFLYVPNVERAANEALDKIPEDIVRELG